MAFKELEQKIKGTLASVQGLQSNRECTIEQPKDRSIRVSGDGREMVIPPDDPHKWPDEKVTQHAEGQRALARMRGPLTTSERDKLAAERYEREQGALRWGRA